MASKRRLRRRQCGKKQRHKQKGEAIAHLFSLAHSPGFVRYAGLTIYRCPFCKQYHVGHKKLN